MSCAFVGPANSDTAALTRTLRWLLFECKAEQVFYFGTKEELTTSTSEIRSGLELPDDLLEHATRLALSAEATAEDIDAFLERHSRQTQLEIARAVPAMPRKHVEMIRNRLMILTRDHRHLVEDDIANATLIVYANSKQSVFKRFGRRAFFAPPPLSEEAVGLLKNQGDQLNLVLQKVEGDAEWTQTILASKTRMTVS